MRPSRASKASIRRSKTLKSLDYQALEPRNLLAAIPLITEFSASNDNILDDEDGDSSDWIEVYNAGDTQLNLADWHLTDDNTNLSKWTFPAVTLDPNEYLVVFASGKDRADADGTELHTNFSLSSNGEYLALVKDDDSTIAHSYDPEYPAQSTDVSYGLVQELTETTLIAEGSDARYLVPTTNVANWNTLGFNDNGWSLGPTGIGYENSPADFDAFIETSISGGTASLYTRQTFNVTDPDSVSQLFLDLRYDDGFVAYLNGVKIAEAFAPTNPAFNSTSLPTQGRNDSDSIEFQRFDISDFRNDLVAGNNVLAIQTLNRSTGSSDMLTEARLTATEATTASSIQAFMVFPTPGSVNLFTGPTITSVTQNPPQPTSNQSLVIEASVSDNATNGISRVDLHYRIDFGTEVTVQAFDNGTGSDAIANDGIYTAVISSSQYSAGDLVRWYVTAEDNFGTTSRAPLFADQSGNNQSAEYFGTVVADSINTALPVFQWFTQNESASHTRDGTRASVYYNGQFYDNIFVRQRGQATNSSDSQKFDFNKGEKLFISEELGSVGEINLNGNGLDSSYVRQPLSFETFAATGHQSPTSFLTYMSVNGSFDRVGVWVEQIDEDFLQRYNLDPDGELYKMVQRSSRDPVFSDTDGVERKTGDESDLSSIQALIDGLNLPTESQQALHIFDHLNLASFVNYLAVRTIIQDFDDVRKNFYVYLDSNNTDEWYIFPWDKDGTFGITGDFGPNIEHPFFGDEEHKKQNADQWNILFDIIFENPDTQQMYLRRLRTLMDSLLQAPGTSNGLFEQRANQIFAAADPHPGPSGSGLNSVLNYFPGQRNDLFLDYGPSGSVESLIPTAQSSSPVLTIGTIDYNPASGDQDQEYIQLLNNSGVAIDISGWTVENAITHTFAPGTVIAAGGSLYITPSASAFRARTSGPSGGQGLFVQEWDSGHLSSFGETITVKRTDGSTAVETTFAGDPTPEQQFLRISEVHYNPVGPTAAEEAAGFDDGDLFEFVELLNTSATETLDLDGVTFSNGIEASFTTVTPLAPGERALVVNSLAAFTQRYGQSVVDNTAAVIEYTSGQLSNGGERVQLDDGTGSTIHDFKYEDGDDPGEEDWTTLPDGDGPSLVVVDTAGDYEDGNNWVASSTIHGTPGTATDAIPNVVTNIRDNGDLARPDLLNTVSIGFDQNVTVVKNDLTFQNATLGGTPVDLSAVTFSYNATSFIAQWDFSGLTTPLPAGFYNFILTSGNITSVDSGETLDGDDNGAAGGNFAWQIYVAIPGDANLDGTVNGLDVDVLAQNFGTAVNSWSEGDFNQTDTVNGLDIDVVAQNFGSTVTVAAPLVTVAATAPAELENSQTEELVPEKNDDIADVEEADVQQSPIENIAARTATAVATIDVPVELSQPIDAPPANLSTVIENTQPITVSSPAVPAVMSNDVPVDVTPVMATPQQAPTETMMLDATFAQFSQNRVSTPNAQTTENDWRTGTLNAQPTEPTNGLAGAISEPRDTIFAAFDRPDRTLFAPAQDNSENQTKVVIGEQDLLAEEELT